MAKRTKSARGEIVDFDILAIRQQLAGAPSTVNVAARRDYIDAKDGIKKKDDADVQNDFDDEDGTIDPEILESLMADLAEHPTDADPLDLVNGK